MNDKQSITERPLQDTGLSVVNPDAAGIDVGSHKHHVAVPEGRDPQPIREFGCYTADLHRLSQWLKQVGIKTVALESTGVYWIPLYEILKEYGFEALLVDARQLKNVSGRKSDVQDCRWIQRLHSYGLLSPAFQPEPAVVRMRAYWRLRANLVADCSRTILHMHKALEQMNVQLHKAVTDVTGLTGMAIIHAIVAGEREPAQLVRFRHPGCKLGAEEFVAALSGNFKAEHVFALRQALSAYDFFQGQLRECDQALQGLLAQMPTLAQPESRRTRKRRKNQPYFDLRAEQIRISGVDLASIAGIDVLTAQVALTEVGPDVRCFPSENHFSSWLCLSPNNRVTGGKIRSRRTRRSAHRLATALRIAAQAVGRSKTALGAFYRRLAARIGAAKAITATARKLACLIYRMLKYGQPFVEHGQAAYEKAQQQRAVNHLHRQARRLGFALVNTASGEVS